MLRTEQERGKHHPDDFFVWDRDDDCFMEEELDELPRKRRCCPCSSPLEEDSLSGSDNESSVELAEEKNQRSETENADDEKDESVQEEEETETAYPSIEFQLKNLHEQHWKMIIEDELHRLVLHWDPTMVEDKWHNEKRNIDRFWANLRTYSGSTLLEDERYHYWKAISMSEDPLIGGIAASLMAVLASEACCERGFSFLRYIYSTKRRNLTIEKLETSLCIQDAPGFEKYLLT
jgi:hypothetical protein